MCDTVVALPSVTKEGSLLFGKNSDREPNEAQILEYHPGKLFDKNETVNCTYLTLPQVRKRNGVLLCRPFWMWGAEMGANEKGLVIGNEAVFTRMPYTKEKKLTGMDLLRLTLERADSAEQGLEVLIQLLSDWGQGGPCGYEDKRLVYHNSFIIADSENAWVLETAGHLWAALKVKGAYSISNGLTIGEEFDRSHPELIDTARKKGWLKRGKTFNFSACYSDWLFTTFSACRTRRNSSYQLLSDRAGELDLKGVFHILRNHKQEDYHPASRPLMDSVCAHAGNGVTRNSNTTGSLVACLKEEDHTFWATATSTPCAAIFKPIWLKDEVLPDLGVTPEGRYDTDSLWWRHEKLHRAILRDYSRISLFQDARDLLEESFMKAADSDVTEHPFEITRRAFAESQSLTEKWIERITSQPPVPSFHPIYSSYWKKQNKKAGLKLP